MATLAHYQVISDGSFYLRRGENQRLMFNPDNDAYLEDTQLRKPILMYSVDPSNDAEQIEIEVYASVGGREHRISVLKVSNTDLRTVTEPIRGELLSHGDNRIWFKVTAGQGSVRISNVIMLYHRRVELERHSY